ncbi:uncharacterized protein LTR77_010426 [Saxophila tyrrhenica]|uniref:Pre-rrna processing protein n=1 Tax=Saxophila tyrrhenica TaxID=1690608 RepID=A0AAV9NY30_9PEZI|nr:hypothetical protein LTR77_010426 [Saxophila tyrrhenica]
MATSRDTHDQDPMDREEEQEDATETSPLLPPSDPPTAPDQSQPHRERSAESLLRRTLSDSSTSSPKKHKSWRQRWPSLLALAVLCLVVVLIMVFAFFAPNIVEQYAKEAAVFTPRSLSVDEFTGSGVRARVQGDFTLDARRVHKKAVRDLGRFGTWVARYAESGESEVEISLPEYGNVVLGTAKVPKVVVDLRNGHTTAVDVLAQVEPGQKEGLRRVAGDWVEGRLGRMRVLGKASVPVKSGIFGFGTQKLREEVVFEEGDVPAVPEYDIRKINVHEAEGDEEGMEADVRLSAMNDYPIDFEVPGLGFEVLVDGCVDSDPYIHVANAKTDETHVRPKREVELDVTGMVRKLPDVLTQDCPDSDKSPLDTLLGNYMRGKENTIYVRGSKSPSKDTPSWITELIRDIVVPVPLPGKSMGHLIRNFTLADTHFSLPDPFADPDAPESQPRISAKVQALVALPEEMNFNISANRVRADADVYYKHKKLGNLDLHRWQPANSTRVEGTKKEGPGLMVESIVDKAPLNITDNDVFADVIQDMVFGDKGVVMQIKADVDVEVETALGEFKVRRIPAEGEVPVKPISSSPSPPSHGAPSNSTSNDTVSIGGALNPKIVDLHILSTTPSSLTLTALLNLTNPTPYTATIPYLDLHIMKNNSLLANATLRDTTIVPGNNSNILVEATYDPLTLGGEEGKKVGREMLSQYISGWNTTVTIKMHEGSIPTLPGWGKVLGRFGAEVRAPRLGVPHHGSSSPGDGDEEDDGKMHFISDATMHLLTSTATFTLLSPLRHSTLIIENLDATAYYHGDSVGHIQYSIPFAVPPVDSEGNGVQSPRLPVEWSLGSVGYEAVKNALGGTLKLGARAEVGVRLGEWREGVWFEGGGIGARVRL